MIDKREVREMVEAFVAAFATVMERHLHEVFADGARRPAPRPVANATAELAPQPKRAAPKRRHAKPQAKQAKQTKQAKRARPARPQPAVATAPAAPVDAKHAGSPRANVDALVEEAWARRQAEQATPTTG